jgi:GNAT superfamily N-acetyltransferase
MGYPARIPELDICNLLRSGVRALNSRRQLGSSRTDRPRLPQYRLEMQEMTIRPITIDEIPDTVRIYIECWRHDYKFIPAEYLDNINPETETAECREWLETDLHNRIIAAYTGNRMAGYIAFSANSDEPLDYEGEINGLFVIPEYRLRAIAPNLLRAALDEFAAWGYSKFLIYNFRESASNGIYRRFGGTLLRSVTQEFCGRPLLIDIFGWEIKEIREKIS